MRLRSILPAFSLLWLPMVLSAEEAVSLFNGTDLSGWHVRAEERDFWKVRDGMIIAGSKERKVPRNTFLVSEGVYENFELTFSVRERPVDGFVNSGMQVRSIRHLRKPNEMSGYQVDVGKGYWGKMYDEGRRNRMIAHPVDPAAVAKVVAENEWLHYRIRCEGPRIRSWINGVAALDYTETEPGMARNGKLGIQAHGGGRFEYHFKDLSITELPPTPGAPVWLSLAGDGSVAPAPPEPPTASNVPGAPASRLEELPEQFIRLTGRPGDAVKLGLDLEGPFTVESWVRLAPGIDNLDSLLALPGKIDINFFDGILRFYAGKPHGDLVVANRPMRPGVWTHCAITRDAEGRIRLFLDGEPAGVSKLTHPGVYPNLNIGTATVPGGSAFDLHEFRIWNRSRPAKEIQATLQRQFRTTPAPEGLVLRVSADVPDLRLEGTAAVISAKPTTEPKTEPKAGTDATPAPSPAIRHSFLGLGKANRAVIVDEDGSIAWRYDAPASDGWVLHNGHVLLALYPTKAYPGGAVIELTRDSKEVVFEYRGTQKEISTVAPLDDGSMVITELGPNPRAVRVDRTGKVVLETALQCQRPNTHMQTRMLRVLPNGNYLVPHLLDFAVKEYDPKTGDVLRTFPTDDRGRKLRDWPFTAIRLANGNTLIGCTNGNRVIEVDADGKIVWSVTNQDLGQDLIRDACGVQRLPNGNTVITSYHAKGDQAKLVEVTPDKKVAWTYKGLKAGFHHFQILTTNGKPVAGTLR